MYYKNCWVVVHINRYRTDEKVLRQRASALLVYEAMLRQGLQNAMEPSTLCLEYYDDEGNRTRIARTLIRRQI